MTSVHVNSYCSIDQSDINECFPIDIIVYNHISRVPVYCDMSNIDVHE
jgi:hypothetical protein